MFDQVSAALHMIEIDKEQLVKHLKIVKLRLVIISVGDYVKVDMKM